MTVRGKTEVQNRCYCKLKRVWGTQGIKEIKYRILYSLGLETNENTFRKFYGTNTSLHNLLQPPRCECKREWRPQTCYVTVSGSQAQELPQKCWMCSILGDKLDPVHTNTDILQNRHFFCSHLHVNGDFSLKKGYSFPKVRFFGPGNYKKMAPMHCSIRPSNNSTAFFFTQIQLEFVFWFHSYTNYRSAQAKPSHRNKNRNKYIENCLISFSM